MRWKFRWKFRWLTAIASAAVVAAAMTTIAPTAARAAGPCGTVSTAPTYTHVIWIWMENHSFGDIIGSSQARTSTRSPANAGWRPER